MKIALFSIASWAIYASASNLKLRSTSNKHVGESASQFTNARVSVFGLKEEVSGEDIDIIGETLVSAYNEMFASPDMHLVSFQPKSAAAIPTEHAKLTGYVLYVVVTVMTVLQGYQRHTIAHSLTHSLLARCSHATDVLTASPMKMSPCWRSSDAPTAVPMMTSSPRSVVP